MLRKVQSSKTETGIEIINNPITSTEIEAVIKKKTKAQDQMASQENFIKHLKKS